MNGYQKIYDFDNGYSASVICNKMSYGGDKGLFEIAVIKNDQICENNPLGRSIVGFLDFAGVVETLEKIKNLPSV